MELLMAQIPKFERGNRKEFLTKRFGLYQRNLDTKQVIKNNKQKQCESNLIQVPGMVSR